MFASSATSGHTIISVKKYLNIRIPVTGKFHDITLSHIISNIGPLHITQSSTIINYYKFMQILNHFNVVIMNTSDLGPR